MKGKAAPGAEAGISYSDAEYFGGFGYTYVIGIDGGATYLNDYIAGTLDYVSRIAGMLLINGNMGIGRNVAGLVPVYLVNAPKKVIKAYKKANQTNAYSATPDQKNYFDQAVTPKKSSRDSQGKSGYSRYHQ